MHAEIVRLTGSEVDIKIVNNDQMHVLQWRRRLFADQVLLDGKSQSLSYGFLGREKVYGLVFGRNEEGQGGERVMLIVDPRAQINWSGIEQSRISGVRLERADGPLFSYGTLDPKSIEKPVTFSEWIKKTMGMEW
ncbi:MAG: hypothetical protein AAF950_14965 [Pseudomonadota bacterium]